MKAIWMAVAVALSLSTVACGNPTKKCEKRCENAAECDGVPDGYEDTCKDGCEALEKLVEDKGCEKEYRKAANCGGTKVDCDAEEADDDCEDQAKDLAECLGG